MTVTSKRQVTFPKDLLEHLGVKKGDRIIAKVKNKKVTLEPAGEGILKFAGKFGSFKIPKGKTIDDLINEAAIHYAGKEVR